MPPPLCVKREEMPAKMKGTTLAIFAVGLIFLFDILR